MAFWVHGRDRETGDPTDPFFSDADSEDAARGEATAQGIIVESVEPHGQGETRQPLAEQRGEEATPDLDTPLRTRYCDGCWRPVPASARCCPVCGAAVEDYPDPAGLVIRVGASLVDILLFLPVFALELVVLSEKNLPLVILLSIPQWTYKPLMESYCGATLGKMAYGLRVVDGSGRKLTLARAYVRFLPFLAGEVLSLLSTLWLFSTPEFENVSGFLETTRLMAKDPFDPLWALVALVILIDCAAIAFTHRKRALHDMMAGSFCVREGR